MKRLFFYMGLVLAVAIAASLGLNAYKLSGQSAGGSRAMSPFGKAAIGGPFTLVDHNGKTVTGADFKGRYMLIFFGYTFCPDVCPTALQTVSDMLYILGKDAGKVAPLFISVDPKRDTVEVLKEYVGHFHPKIIGLTGSQEQIVSVAKVYRVYFSKVTDEEGDPESYWMNHTALLYLMGPDGKFITAFKHQIDSQDMAERIRKYL